MAKSQNNQNASQQQAQQQRPTVTPVAAAVETELDFKKKYYLGHDTTQISSTLVDQKITGSVGNKNPNIPAEVSVTYAANKKRHDMHLHFITKSQQGKFTLNTLFPMLYSDFSKNPTSNNPFDNVSVYVAVAAHGGQYERNVGTLEKPQYALTYSNGNLANFGRMFTSKRITGATITANISQGLIPASVNAWTNKYPELIKGNEYSVGTVINRFTLNTWKQLRTIQANAAEQYETDAEKTAALEAVWNKYQKQRAAWEIEGYLVSSNILYAIENGVKNTTAAELGYSNAAPELNAASLYGTAEGEMSFIPETNRAHMTAILTDATTDETGNFHYGIYPQNIRNKNELVTLTDQDDIRRTAEVCTRELLISDGAGNNVTISARMKDNAFGSARGEDNQRSINKRSRAFYDVPVGTQVVIVGSKLVPRYSKEGTQAIRFELHDLNYKVMNAASSNLVIGDLTSEQIDYNNDEQLAMLNENLDDFDLDDVDTLSAKQSTTETQTAVSQSTAQDDSEM